MGASSGICGTDREQPLKNYHISNQQMGVPWVCDFVQQCATKCIDAHVALGNLVNRASKHQDQDRDGGDFPHSTGFGSGVSEMVPIFFEKNIAIWTLIQLGKHGSRTGNPYKHERHSNKLCAAS